MVAFILQRILNGLFSLGIVLLISCWMIRLIPGSYEEIMKAEQGSEEQSGSTGKLIHSVFYFSILPEKEAHSSRFYLFPDFHWNGTGNEFHQTLVNYLSGHFGKSVTDQQEVSSKMLQALPWSICLQLPAVLLTLLLSIWLARKSFLHPTSFGIQILRKSLIWLHSIPVFWLASLLLLFLANPDMLQLFPTGMQNLDQFNPWTVWIFQTQFMILPLLCFVIPSLAYLCQLLSNGLEESAQKFYWLRALSTGMTLKQTLIMESTPILAIPIIAWIGGIFPALISGSIIIEQIFSIPGLGRLMYHSISVRDWPMVQFLLMIGSACTVFGLLVSDILYRFYFPQLNTKA